MKQRSTAKKFKIITGSDLYAKQKKFELESKKEDGELTELIDFLQYGLYLALYSVDITKARQDFKEYLETDEFDTNGKTLQNLFEEWAKEIK